MLKLEAAPVDLERCFKWELGKDEPLVSFNEHIRLARSRVKFDEGMRPPEEIDLSLAGVDWRRSMWAGWMLKVGFLANLKDEVLKKYGDLPPRYDAPLLIVWILPNGGEVHASWRPMTEEELVMWGIKQQQPIPGSIPPPPFDGKDPFAPPPVPSKKP
jgi:hypothetical protein